jgi:hypothetical protein
VLLHLGEDRFGEGVGLEVGLQVAVLDDVVNAGEQGRFGEVGVGVAEEVDADTADHVPLDRAVGEFDESAVPDSRADEGVEEWPAPDIGGALHQGVVLGLERRVGRANVGDQGRLHADLVDNRGDAVSDGRAREELATDGRRAGLACCRGSGLIRGGGARHELARVVV